MAWNNPFKKEEVVPDPEKKADDKAPEKSVADIIAEAMKPLADSMTAMRGELETVKTRLPEEKKAPVTTSEVPSVLDDENLAFQARLTPILQGQLELEARVVKREVEEEYRSQGYGDFWDQNRAELNKAIDGMPLVIQTTTGVARHRGDKGAVAEVVDRFIGSALRKGGLKFDAGKKSFFLEDASGSGEHGNHQPDITEGLTRKQVEAAKKMGIPLDKYKAAVEKLEFVQ